MEIVLETFAAAKIGHHSLKKYVYIHGSRKDSRSGHPESFRIEEKDEKEIENEQI